MLDIEDLAVGFWRVMPPLRLAALMTCAALSGGWDSLGATGEDHDLFERRIRPALIEHCHRCHSSQADAIKGGLRVDSREALLHGGDSGPALVAGAPEKSLILRALGYEDPDLQMPPKTRLPASVVADFRTWIQAGAPWPTSGSQAHVAAAPNHGFSVEQRKAEHWAWRAVAPTTVPVNRNSEWARSDLDRFVLARLEAAGLRPAPVADRRTLIRRASFALTGLPPEAAEVEAFVSDSSPVAWERVVDRGLTSPHFGEHWARHWMDKVRYAETLGHEFDYPILGAWRYRDYLVRSLNRDLPYDQFAREQIAGDLMTPQRIDPETGSNESRVATAHYWFVQQVHSPVDVKAHIAEVIDNQIDVVTKSFLGLTVACARCHDHKFDAISARDYYALYGIFDSSRLTYRAVDDPQERRLQAEALTRLRERLRQDWARQCSESRGAAVPTAIPEGARVERPEDQTLDLRAWQRDGEAFESDPDSAGQPVVLADGSVRLSRPGWIDGGALSARFQGVARSPTFDLDQGYVHVLVAGSGTRISLAVEGFSLIRSPIYGGLRRPVRDVQPHWITFDVAMWKGRKAWLECADLTATDPASDLPAKEAAAPEGWIAIGAAVVSPHPAPPGNVVGRGEIDSRTVWDRWENAPARLSASEVAFIEATIRQAKLPPNAAILAQIRDVEDRIQPPVLAAVMADGTGRDEAVFIRGNHRTRGPVVPRRFLEALSPDGASEIFPSEGSGRLALADAVTHPDNPFFSRVMVNWIWAHLFGRGLVSSIDNFGVLGDAPTHPELLDFLADEFRRDGYSIKRAIRRMMLSSTWQMSAVHPDGEVALRDPENRLWHRATVRRVEGESLRDAMLAVSGRLQPVVGGPPVPIHLTPFMDGRGRPQNSGPRDGDGRRSLYVEVRRNFLSPWMLAFDAPVPATTVGRRSVSNVPAQALALMNDPLVGDLSRAWAERLLRETATADPASRLQHLYMAAYGRPATGDDVAAALGFVEARRDVPGGSELEAWSALCHVLFNTKQFAFVD